MSAEDAFKATAALFGAVTALLGTMKTIAIVQQARRERLAREAERLSRLDTIVEQVARFGVVLADINHELKANGGGSLRDVITEIRNEHALERAARRVIANAASYEIRVDPRSEHAETVHVSPQFVQLTGLTRDDCDDGGWVRAVSAGDRDRVQRLAEKAARDGTVLATTYEIRNVHSGAQTEVEHVATPVLNYAGSVVGWVGVYRDLTTQRRLSA